MIRVLKAFIFISLFNIVVNASGFSFNSPKIIPQSVISRPSNYWQPQDWWFMNVNSVDWDNDGDEDLLCGVKDYNMESYSAVGAKIVYYENIGTATSPVFEFNGFLKAGGTEIDVQNS